MSTNPDNFGRRDSVHSGDHYLDASIRTASPARLRLMLIERGVEVASRVASLWTADKMKGTNEHSLRLLDILNELLSGVVGSETDAENEVCQQVADLYVFLAKHLIAAEENSDVASIEEIRTVLSVEAETWRAVCAQESPIAAPVETTTPIAGGLNLQG